LRSQWFETYQISLLQKIGAVAKPLKSFAAAFFYCLSRKEEL
jgi:hypothetical protein